MKRYGPKTSKWVPVKNPRKHPIGSKVYGTGRNGKYDRIPGTLIASYQAKGVIHEGYYIIEYPNGETRTFMVIHQV